MSTIIQRLFVIVLLILPLAKAQAQDLPPNIEKQLNTILSQAVNASILFSAPTGLSSGRFRFRNPDGSDPEFEVIKGRLAHVFGETNDTFRPFIDGSVGYFRYVEEESENEDSDFFRLRTLDVSAGTGAEIIIAQGLTIKPAFRIAYVHSRNAYDYNNPTSQQVLAPFDRNIFNWSVDSIAYLPSFSVLYEIPVFGAKVDMSARYDYIYTESQNSKSNIINIRSDSSLLQTRLAVVTPLGNITEKVPASLTPFVVRNDIYGDGRHAFGLNSYWEVGAELGTLTKDIIDPINELSATISYAFGEHFDGWRLGLGLAF